MSRLFWRLIGTLLLVGLVLRFIWYIVGAAVVVGAGRLAVRLRRAWLP